MTYVDANLPIVDPKVLLGAIGNALYQERLIWSYEVEQWCDKSGKTDYNLHIVLIDPGGTELIVETLEDEEAGALLFRSRSAPPALLEICCRTQVDLTEGQATRVMDGVFIVPPATAIDLFMEAILEHLALCATEGRGSCEA